GNHPDPSPHVDVITTTTHKTLRGPRGGMFLCKEEHAAALDKAVFPCLQGGPHNHTTAAIAVALKEAASPDYSVYCGQIIKNAKALAAALQEEGFDIVTGGTDNHLMLVDVTSKGLGGREAASAMNKAGVVCNSNAIPFDPRKPWDPSGLRIGTPAVTSRGMKEEEMKTIAKWISEVLANIQDEGTQTRVKGEVKELCDQFPAPGIAC
ncbi:MAG: serine hydroxymethyltransferase, partial [Candidatus Omnitrophica bacterium]|nr:serine hydroxymethyltransferase [Candidatus Omnitrophota bacterium]